MHRGLWLIAVVGIAGCFERPLELADPCTRLSTYARFQYTEIDQIDLLLVIQNTSSMADERVTVAHEIPRIITMLATGDRDADGSADFTPPRSLHVGIVDSDMGVGDVTGVPTCDPGFGDDGLMQVRSDDAPPCRTSYRGPDGERFFDFHANTSAPTSFASDVGCVADLGTDGCGYPQSLEAALKAISLVPSVSGESPVSWTRPGYRPPTFFSNTFGHGDDLSTNGRFLRPDSVLAIVTIGDRDDCSTSSPDIFSLDDPTHASADPALRCHTFASELQPIARFVDGFARLRRNPAMLVYTAITGVPTTFGGMNPAEILASPEMQPRIDPTMPHQLVPACGTAEPGVRMTQLAQELAAAGVSTSVQSICNDDFSPAFEDIVRSISEAIAGRCLPRELDPDVDGFIACDVYEVLPEGGRCDALEPPDTFTFDHEEHTSAGDGTTTSREVCLVRQVGRAGAGIEPGWAYDDADPRLMRGWSALAAGCRQDIRFSAVDPTFGAEIRLLCDETLVTPTSAPVQLGTRCDPGTGRALDVVYLCADGSAVEGNPITLRCDPVSATCQIPCTRDADCASAGLPAYRCDLRSARGMCERPTCSISRR